LLGIADQYGLSVASLQEANGILDPRSLQLGQQLIIPREEELEPEALTTPTPTPLPVNVENVHFAETQIGGLWVLGEVYNDGDVPLEQVRVGVDLVDEQDNPIAQASSLLSLDLIDLGERAPFAVLFGTAPESFERYQVYPMSAVPAYVGSYYRDLEVRDLSGESEGVASYIVSGRIFNFGPEEAVSVQAVLTAYDPLDRVIAMRKIDPDHNVVPVGGETAFSAVLAPEIDPDHNVVPVGGETAFSAVLAPVGGPVARVEAVAQGRRISSVQD
jgi:hypothetical protein